MRTNVIAAMFIATASLSFAHEGATGVVAERMDAMSAIGDANKQLSNISRGRADFDLTTVVQSANAIAEHAGQGFVDLFPEGSLSEVSDAKAEIWQNWDKFSELSLSLETAAIDLAKITDEQDYASAYKAVSQTCSSCHRAYRARR